MAHDVVEENRGKKVSKEKGGEKKEDTARAKTV